MAGAAGKRLAGRVALVTGSSRGIGRAIALRLAAEGAQLALHCREKRERAEGVAAEIRALGGRAEVFAGDVRREAEVGAMLAAALEVFPAIDIWVNNAGVEFEEPLAEIRESSWEQTFAVNVKGLFFCCRAAGAHMLARTGEQAGTAPVETGVIVNIASRFGLLGDPASLPYGASKAAVINITKALAKHYAPWVRVNCVAPAYTETDMMAHVDEEYRARFHAATPLGRVALPEDTAAAVAFLASPDAAFTTGATLPVDGGYTLK
ncbi:MAG: glucose 1-dehydrogenase [bacterium]